MIQREIAKSCGIVGGDGGPTSIWRTTQLPGSKDCPQEK